MKSTTFYDREEHAKLLNGQRADNGMLKLNNMLVDDEYFNKFVTKPNNIERVLIEYITLAGFEEEGCPACTLDEAVNCVHVYYPEYTKNDITEALWLRMPPFQFSLKWNIKYNPRYYPIIDM